MFIHQIVYCIFIDMLMKDYKIVAYFLQYTVEPGYNDIGL
jgi:hypothetical protein